MASSLKRSRNEPVLAQLKVSRADLCSNITSLERPHPTPDSKSQLCPTCCLGNLRWREISAYHLLKMIYKKADTLFCTTTYLKFDLKHKIEYAFDFEISISRPSYKETANEIEWDEIVSINCSLNHTWTENSYLHSISHLSQRYFPQVKKSKIKPTKKFKWT